jgi:hypothetical protein
VYQNTPTPLAMYIYRILRAVVLRKYPSYLRVSSKKRTLAGIDTYSPSGQKYELPPYLYPNQHSPDRTVTSHCLIPLLQPPPNPKPLRLPNRICMLIYLPIYLPTSPVPRNHKQRRSYNASLSTHKQRTAAKNKHLLDQRGTHPLSRL